jgi:peptidoglycan hydrolase-like protein with peptidoglycan-binding domain
MISHVLIALVSLAALALVSCSPTTASVPPTASGSVQVVVPVEPPARVARSVGVRHLQVALNRSGYHLRVDGVCGRETQRAVADYQIDLGIRLQSDRSCRVGNPTMVGLGLIRDKGMD